MEHVLEHARFWHAVGAGCVQLTKLRQYARGVEVGEPTGKMST